MSTVMLNQLLAKQAAEDGTGVEPEVTEEMAGIDLPESKAVVMKMTGAKLDELYEKGNLPAPISGWSDMKVGDKKEALIKVLFEPQKEPSEDSEEVVLEPEASKVDKLSELATKIENLSGQADLEARVDALLESDGLNDFQLGGYLARLQETADFSPHKNFAEYVFERFGIKYRKAMYLVEIYTGLVKASIPYGEVKAIGWTKLTVLISVLTSENAAEWIAKAKAMNVPSLQQAVKDYKQAGNDGAVSDTPTSNMKTKSFKLGPDQVETVEGAIEKAQEVSGTEVPSAALEFICLEYLGNAPSKDVADAKLTKQVEKLTAENEALSGQLSKLEASNPTMPSPAEFYAWVRQTQGDLKSALEFLFGDDSEFAETFPEISLAINAADAPADA